jgi:hypothetical protein
MEYTNWDDGWTITFNTSTYKNVSSTHTVFTPVSSGNNTSAAYASLYYDSNNTSYYVDPASTSNLNALLTYSYQGNGNVGGTGNASWHPSGIYSAGYNWLYGGINGGGSSATNFGDVRANIFYDYTNTGFYIDAASTSVINSIQVNTAIGVGTAPSATTGEIRATNNITAYYSDARLKTFLSTIPNALEKVEQLSGYYFIENEIAKSLGYDNDERQVGVSAQEVQLVLPEAVAPAPISDEYLTVRYEKIVPLLIQAIKELAEKVRQLENR